jgi:amino acid permease
VILSKRHSPCSGYYLFYPGAFDGPTFVFTYGSAFIFLAIYAGSTTYSVVRTKSASFFVPARELDFQSGLQEIEDLTRASDEKRALKQGHRSLGQKISDFFF